MKKTLLLLASVLLCVSSFAQNWTKPSPVYSAEFKTSTLASDNQGDSIIYYLYNIEGDGFITGGTAAGHSQWSTNAVLKSQGNPIMIGKYELTETGTSNVDSSEPAEWDGKTYIIYDKVGSAWKSIIITSATGCFVDRNKQIDYKWEIISQGNSVYYIKSADVNPNYNNAALGFEEAYFGFDGLDGDYLNSPDCKPITPAINMSDADMEPHIKWAFVAEADYNLYQAKVKLYNTLNEAVENGVDYAAASAVYNNAAATEAEITAAANELASVIKDAEFNKASEDNPVNVSNWLVNADFSAGNINGWECTFVSGTNAKNVGYQSNKDYTNGDVTISKFIEAWTPTAYSAATTSPAIGVGRLCQTIADMPAGKYRLSVDCIAVSQNNAANNPVSGVQLFATGGEIDLYTSIATGNGLPEHFELDFMNSGGEITMGLRTTEACTANWIAADNFQLYYLGQSAEDPYKTALDNLIQSSVSDTDPDALDEVYANADAKAAYKSAISTAQSTSDYKSSIDEINNTLSALKASIAAYSKLATVYNYYLAKMEAGEEYGSDEWGEFADYVQGNADEDGTLLNALTTGSLLDSEIDAKVTEIHAAYKNAIVKAIEKYEGNDMNVSGLITNASFETGDMTGWSCASGTVDTGVKENSNETYNITNADGNYVFNTWHSAATDFFVKQDLGAIPAGVYELTVLVASDPDNAIVVAAGEATAEVVTENEKGVGQDVTLKFVVAEGQESLVVKVSSTGWFKADYFRLAYKGMDDSALKEILTSKVNEVKSYIEEVTLTTPVEQKANKVIDEAEKASGSEEINAAITSIADLFDEVKKNAATVEEYSNAYGKLEAALGSPANESAVADYEAIADEIAEDKAMTLTTEELTALNYKITSLAGKLATVIPESSDWTSLIVNPSFDDATADGWTYKFAAITNIGYQKASYTNDSDGTSISQFIEGWRSGNNAIGDGSIEQTIPYLPAGTYSLGVDAIANLQSSTDETWSEVTKGIYLFASQNGSVLAKTEIKTANGKPQHFTLDIPVAVEGAVTIGIMAESATANWIAADNWTLTQVNADAINAVAEGASTAVEGIYSISGARINNLQKGINIVKMSNGTVQKVLVK